MPIYLNEIIRSGDGTILGDFKRRFKMNDRDQYIDLVRDFASTGEIPQLNEEKYKKAVSLNLKLVDKDEAIRAMFSRISDNYKDSFINLFREFLRKDEEDSQREKIAVRLLEELQESVLMYFQQEVNDDIKQTIDRNYSHNFYENVDHVPHAG
jgi:hypothetical protein